MDPGQYFHNGIEMGLLAYDDQVLLKLAEISLIVSTDGFQLAKSSNLSGWSIFARIKGIHLDPFLIGLYVRQWKAKKCRAAFFCILPRFNKL